MEARITAISHPEALRYLGVRGEAPPELLAALPPLEKELLSVVRPRAVWRIFSLLPDGTLEGTAFRPEGQDLKKLFAGCGRAVLLAATLGAGADDLIRRRQSRDMASAVILDALCGAAIENVCDNLCEDLAEALSPARLTPRFSPGYGDFPLSQQAALCAVLNAERRIGLTLTPGGLLLPQKSVTAVIGVSDAPAARDRDSAEDSPGSGAPGGCASCSMYAHCSFRREGSSCGKP